MNLNLTERLKEVDDRLSSPEQILGATLNEPYTNTNSGSRKIMFSTHSTQKLSLLHPEPPFVSTGYEDQFGTASSSFCVAEQNKTILAKIPKFANVPNPYNHYFVIFLNEDETLDIMERAEFKNTTESFGYAINNSYIDELDVGETIFKGSVIKKSVSYDEFNSRMDGVNLNLAYMALDETKEDAIVISQSGANKLSAIKITPINLVINENDIVLNLYGNYENHKMMPDIGEEVNKGILCAIRRQNKGDSLFTQARNRLADIMMSDEKILVNGTVIDINVYCNNVDYLSESPYYSQIYFYHLEHMKFYRDLTRVLNDYDTNMMSYELQKMYSIAKRALNGAQYTKDRKFSNISMDITVAEINPLNIGDKLTDRYGGKGVVSAIWPDEQMPTIEDTGEKVEIIKNQLTFCNRENAGQLFEISDTFIGSRVIQYINDFNYHIYEALEEYIKYAKAVNKEYGEHAEKILRPLIVTMDYDGIRTFLYGIINDGGIMIPRKPISDSMSIDKLAELYKIIPYATQYTMQVPIIDSNGNIRRITARRRLTIGKQYIYRLKQYAEEKHSATSLSATNIAGNNCKSKAGKENRSPLPKTPIKIGEMEMGDMLHAGLRGVVAHVMVHSGSPVARRTSTEPLLTGDPHDVNIVLDENHPNRNAESFTAYFKTMGYAIEVIKIPITRGSVVTRHPFRQPFVSFDRYTAKQAVHFVDENENFDPKYIVRNLPKYAVVHDAIEYGFEGDDPRLQHRKKRGGNNDKKYIG